MAYSKDDFVNFSELDLDFILGDFTESECDFSSSDCDEFDGDKLQKGNTQNVQSKKQYECDECDKTYASISGLRGHLRSKHGKENIQGKLIPSCMLICRNWVRALLMTNQKKNKHM